MVYRIWPVGVEAANARCFQLMEGPDRESLTPWIEFWSDLVEFEVIPVVTSAEYWERVWAGSANQ